MPAAPPRHLPVATYRVQLHAGFTFDDVAALAPYLARLGVSHVYCSPYLQAAPGSTHGYDVVDPGRLNVELGGEAGFARMVAGLAEHGLSQVLDVVPNHMSTKAFGPAAGPAGRGNAWWWDVLEDGPASRWAAFFDIDWQAGDGRVLLPILGDRYGTVLESGELRIERQGGALVVRYFAHEAPLAWATAAGVLARAAAGGSSDELAAAAAAAAALPAGESRHRAKEGLRERLDTLLVDGPGAPALAAAVDAAIAAVNADADALDAVLQGQNYRLAYWRTARDEVDYRRFFDIAELVALRTEDPLVFEEVHELVLHLVASGAVQGLRVDHPDGLRDPAAYFARLRSAVGDGTYLVAEKVFATGETLPPWAVDGTTGYDFLALVTGLFVDPAGEAPLTDLYDRFTGETCDFADVAADAKQQVMRESLAADLDRLTILAVRVCDRHREVCDYTRWEVRHAVRDLVGGFGVYRTYVVPAADPLPAGGPMVAPSEGEVAAIDAAVAEARRRNADLDTDLLVFLRDVLLGRVPGRLEAELALRLQQFCAPVTAKGIEDTAFYRYLRLVALNEVGGDPGRWSTAVDDFHRHNLRIAADWPSTMLATSTHDTKRSEDVRVRIAGLSEIAVDWAAAVPRWCAHNARHGSLDAATEYLLYQTLVGAWPIEAARLQDYVEKAVREAKRQTSWLAPDPAFERSVREFVAAVAADGEFIADLEAFVEPVAAAARVTSLAQTLLKLTCPGVPDVYQGTELWDLSLVDPDNRRPVDYDLRRRLLDKVQGMAAADAMAWPDDGAPKLWLITRALAARRRADLAPAFAPGGAYRPLTATGRHAERVVAFVRGDDAAVVVVPRLALGLGRAGGWGDTALELPPGTWRDALDGSREFRGAPSLRELTAGFPVALLSRG